MYTDDPVYKEPLPADPLERQAEIDRRIETRIQQIIRRRKLVWRMAFAGLFAFAAFGGWVTFQVAPERTAASYIAEAARLRDAGAQVAAFGELKSLLLKEPEHAEARWMLAKLYLAAGLGAAAADQLRHLRVSASLSGDLSIAQVQALLLAGRYAAVACDGNYSCEGAEGPRLTALRAEAKLGLKDFEGAEKLLGEAGSAAAGSVQSLLVLAKIKLAQWQPEDAEKLLRSVLERDESSVEAWLVKGELELARSRLDAASVAFEAARARAPRHPDVQIGLARIHLGRHEFAEAKGVLSALPTAARKSPTALYLKAALAWQDQEMSEARAALLNVLAARPEHLDALFLLAAVSYRELAYYQAENRLLRLLELSPDDVPARRLLADVYMALGQPLKAIAAARPLAEAGNVGPRLTQTLHSAVEQSQDTETPAWLEALLAKRVDAAPQRKIVQLARCRVLVHFCEQCVFVRECV